MDQNHGECTVTGNIQQTELLEQAKITLCPREDIGQKIYTPKTEYRSTGCGSTKRIQERVKQPS